MIGALDGVLFCESLAPRPRDRDTRGVNAFDDLVEAYPAWWIDFLGEHNHIGGVEATKWLIQRSELSAGKRMLDCGAFVGAAARLATTETGCAAVALDIGPDFLDTGRHMPGGEKVDWVIGSAAKLPFEDAAFDSVWCLDSYLAPRELSRVAKRSGATMCLCSEAPVDGRGGLEAFLDEMAEYGWELGSHKQLSFEALHTWRQAEGALVARRSYYEARYGKRAYLAHLDMLSDLVRSYERSEQGHGLFVFRR